MFTQTVVPYTESAEHVFAARIKQYITEVRGVSGLTRRTAEKHLEDIEYDLYVGNIRTLPRIRMSYSGRCDVYAHILSMCRH